MQAITTPELPTEEPFTKLYWGVVYTYTYVHTFIHSYPKEAPWCFMKLPMPSKIGHQKLNQQVVCKWWKHLKLLPTPNWNISMHLDAPFTSHSLKWPIHSNDPFTQMTHSLQWPICLNDPFAQVTHSLKWPICLNDPLTPMTHLL